MTMSWLEKAMRDAVRHATAEEVLTELAWAFEREAGNDEDFITQRRIVAIELRRIAAEF